MNRDDQDGIVSERRMLRSSMAAIVASPCEGEDRNVELCFRMKGEGFRNYWMFISIPAMATTIYRLSRVGSGFIHKHEHDLDDAASALPAKYNILQNRFRLVSACDQLKGPFPSPAPYFTPVVSSAVLDSTVYCLGGDPNDIPDCSRGILFQRGTLDSTLPGLPSNPREYDIKRSYAVALEEILSRNLKPPVPGDGICHYIYTLNMLEPLSGWRKAPEPLISPRLTPHLVSFRGKIYAFSGNLHHQAFAEVYDPASHCWTQLPLSPFGWLPDTCFSVVPLKDSGKLWVVTSTHKDDIPRDYTFDVFTGLWEERRVGSSFFDLPKHSRLTSGLNRHNHMVVYWIDDHQIISAYNLETCQLFTGSLSSEPPLQNPTSLGLHHLHLDYFVLIRCDNPVDKFGVESVLHVTLIQISILTSRKSRHRNSLKPSVLACFAYPFMEHIRITDSYLMSNGI